MNLQQIKFLLVIHFLLTMGFVHAQDTSQISIDLVKQKFSLINQNFDSAFYMGFNIQYIYNSMDSNGNVVNSASRDSRYVINKKNVYYDLGDVEYMQNNSLSFLVYKNNKTIFVSNRKVPTAMHTTPMHDWMDSIINAYNQYYNISVTSSTAPIPTVDSTASTDSTGIDSTGLDSTIVPPPNNGVITISGDTTTIIFQAKPGLDSTVALKYTSFSLSYNTETYLLSKAEFHYPETNYVMVRDSVVTTDTSALFYTNSGDTIIKRDSSGFIKYMFMSNKAVNYQKVMTAYFYNYNLSSTDPGIFKNERYVYMDGMRNRYQVVNAYRGYRLFVSGVDQSLLDNNSR